MNIYTKGFLLLLLVWQATTSFAQLSYNTLLVGRWSNDSLPALGNPDGQRFNELWGYYDSAKYKEYIIMGGLDSTYFFDVTNPAKIKLCDVEAGVSKKCINRDYQTYSHYAYAVNDQYSGSLQVWDLKYLPDSVHKVYDSDSLGGTTHTICVYKDYLFMCSNSKGTNQRHSMRIASLAKPDSPAFVAVFDAPIVGGVPLFSNIHDMIIVDDTAYLSCGNDGLFIFNFADPLNPKYIYSLTTYPEKGYNHNSWLTSDKKHIVFTDENLGLGVKLYEIQNPTTYKLKSIFRSHTGALAHNPFIVGNGLVYISYYQDGVYLFDISDDANPKVIAYYDTYPENTSFTGFQGSWGVYPYLPSGTIFASDMSHGLFALRMGITGIQGNKKSLEAMVAYPNPATSEVSFKLFTPENTIAKITIADATGKIILHDDLQLNFGKNELNKSISNYSSGIYFVTINTPLANYTTKFAVQ